MRFDTSTNSGGATHPLIASVSEIKVEYQVLIQIPPQLLQQLLMLLCLLQHVFILRLSLQLRVLLRAWHAQSCGTAPPCNLL